METWTVYKHTSPSGKHYIGITKQKVSLRWRKKGQGYKGCAAFYNAIQKYGWDNFKHEIVLDNLSEEEAKTKERELIVEYNSLIPYGYNIDKGGSSGNRPEIPIYMLSIKNGKIIKEFESIQKAADYFLVDRSSVSKAITDKYAFRNYIFIYKTDYNKDNVAELVKEYEIKVYKKEVYQYEYNTHKFINKYSSIVEASVETNTRRTDISTCLSGTHKSANGYIWSNSEIIDFSKFDRKTNAKKVDIYVYLKDGSFYRKYLSVPDASKDLNIDQKKIRSSLDSKYDLIYDGFIFSYTNRKVNPVNKGHGTLAEKIYQFDSSWNLIAEYKSASQASESIIKKDKSSTLNSALKDYHKTAYGFHWLREGELYLLKSIKNEYSYLNEFEITTKLRKESVIINQYTKDGKFVNKYISFTEASKQTGIGVTHIRHAATNSKFSHAGGFLWRIDGDDTPVVYHGNGYTSRKPIIKKDKSGNVLEVYVSVNEAARSNNLLQSNISACLCKKTKSCGGYVWEYVEQEIDK